jgi:hypothetical protein
MICIQAGTPIVPSCEALRLHHQHDSMSPQTPAMRCWRSAARQPIVAEGTLGVLEMDNDVGGELFGDCRVLAASDVDGVGTVLELTMQPRRMRDAPPAGEVVTSSVQISCDVRIAYGVRLRFDTENVQVNVLLHGVADTRTGETEDRPHSVGDPRDLTSGTVRIFPPLRSCST